MKNIERVWKAEQKHEAEVKKIEELQKELVSATIGLHTMWNEHFGIGERANASF